MFQGLDAAETLTNVLEDTSEHARNGPFRTSKIGMLLKLNKLPNHAPLASSGVTRKAGSHPG